MNLGRFAIIGVLALLTVSLFFLYDPIVSDRYEEGEGEYVDDEIDEQLAHTNDDEQRSGSFWSNWLSGFWGQDEEEDWDDWEDEEDQLKVEISQEEQQDVGENAHEPAATPEPTPAPQPQEPEAKPQPQGLGSNWVDPEKKDKIVFAMCMPSTTKRTGISSVGQLPLLTHFMNTFTWSLEPPNPKYVYKIYLGYDAGDPFYDVPSNLDALQAHFKQNFPSIELIPVRCVDPGSVVAVWNIVVEAAYKDGADFLYSVNDDLEFKSQGWGDIIVQTLRGSQPIPYLGAAGPLDHNNRGIFTQSCVHRLHVAVHGSYFPPSFANWHSDDWITRVYLPEHTFWLRERVQVFNTNAHGTRYDVVFGDSHLAQDIHGSRQRVVDFFDACYSTGGPDCPLGVDTTSYKDIADFYRARIES